VTDLTEWTVSLCRAGLAALRHIVRERLPAHAAAVGARLERQLLAVRRERHCVGDVRGRGLIVELGGRHDAVVRFLPPLIVTAGQVDAIVERFAAAVEAAELGWGHW
jgi:diaminobutyrate-2-oxoglutarate transaminase